jgi:hypothetical protein
MPPFPPAGHARSESRILLPRLVLAFTLALAVVWLAGRPLVEALLPITRHLLDWIDDRFTILHLGIDHTVQDTVIRLRVNLVRPLVVGSHLSLPSPKGWLEVTTTVGAMLQPLAIALGIAGAWPDSWRQRLRALALAFGLSLTFMVIDIPLTLHAYVWDMFVFHYDPQRISPLMAVHGFLHGGGRLALGMLFGALAILAAIRFDGRRQPTSRVPPNQ